MVLLGLEGAFCGFRGRNVRGFLFFSVKLCVGVSLFFMSKLLLFHHIYQDNMPQTCGTAVNGLILAFWAVFVGCWFHKSFLLSAA